MWKVANLHVNSPLFDGAAGVAGRKVRHLAASYAGAVFGCAEGLAGHFAAAVGAVSDWILYDEFVGLVQRHHQNAYSGLITGLSDRKHSFQVGFDRGDIVLLSYRVRKGLAALPLITQIERAKITDHPASDIADSGSELIDTGTVLSQLAAHTLDETTSMTTASEIGENAGRKSNPGIVDNRRIDRRLRLAIETAAAEHFGPIGAMICEDHLEQPGGDLKTVLMDIAQDLDAGEVETQAFFRSVFNS